MNNWWQISAHVDPAPDDWSPIADVFGQHGVGATQQIDTPPMMIGYVEAVDGSAERAQELARALESAGASPVTVTTVEGEDWSALWKQFFKTRRVGKRVVLRPTWEEATVRPDDIEVVLDPGQAFGTGDHPTSRLCLRLLENADLGGKSVLDLGCGSGILAIAAAKMGAETVLGTDIDPTSVEISRENARLNGVEIPFAVSDGFPDSGPWDVVVSNIISATLIRLAPAAYQAVKPGGLWMVSGIIEQNFAGVVEAAERCGFRLTAQEQEDEWVAATFCR